MVFSTFGSSRIMWTGSPADVVLGTPDVLSYLTVLGCYQVLVRFKIHILYVSIP